MAKTLEHVASESQEYPTSDGRPMAETDVHRDLMVALIKTLQAFYAQEPMTYVSGNLLLFYVRGDKRRHVSPDVFVVKGVPKRRRDNYLTWEEGKGPDIVIELTSKSTRDEDLDEKFHLYRDRLKVPEYFLFDPKGDYLDPPLRGYRLENGEYVPIAPEAGRFPSAVLGLHLEQSGSDLRLWNPATGQWLLTPEERAEQEAQARQAAEQLRQQEAQARQAAEQLRQQEAQARQAAEAEVERLRRELEELRRRQGS